MEGTSNFESRGLRIDQGCVYDAVLLGTGLLQAPLTRLRHRHRRRGCPGHFSLSCVAKFPLCRQVSPLGNIDLCGAGCRARDADSDRVQLFASHSSRGPGPTAGHGAVWIRPVLPESIREDHEGSSRTGSRSHNPVSHAPRLPFLFSCFLFRSLFFLRRTRTTQIDPC